MIAPIKKIVERYLFQSGSPRRILLGPLRGFRYRPSPLTGLSPLYSGAERFLQRAVCEHLHPGDVAVDAGANWGLHTLLMARLVGSNGRVMAFEPYPTAYNELVYHVELNDARGVQHFPVALARAPGILPFRIGGSSTTGRLGDSSEFGTGLITVPVRTLDEVVQAGRITRLDLIKVDVEGGEYNLLQGAESVIQEFRPILIIELHNPQQDVAVAGWLAKNGYSPKRISSGPPIERPTMGWPDRAGVWGTIIAFPRRT